NARAETACRRPARGRRHAACCGYLGATICQLGSTVGVTGAVDSRVAPFMYHASSSPAVDSHRKSGWLSPSRSITLLIDHEGSTAGDTGAPVRCAVPFMNHT